MLAAVLVTLLGAAILAATALARHRRLRAERLLAERARRQVPTDERTAAHEAGHAILAWVSPKVIRLTTVTMDDEDGDAVVRFDRKELRTNADLWDSITIGLAGIAAEGLAFESVKAGGARRDLERAAKWAEGLAASGDPLATFPFAEPKAISRLDIGRLYETRPSPLACDVLNLAYRRAKDVIAMRPDKFDALRTLLRERRTLDPSEVEAVLGPRPWAGAG